VKLLKTILLILFLFWVCTPLTAQKLSKYYSSRYQADATLYFFHPNEDFKSKNERSVLVFDLTYLADRDSATINFSIFTDKPQGLDSIFFKNSDSITGAPVSKLFLDFEKRKWHNRFSAKIPFTTFSAFIHSDDPPQIMVSSHGYRTHYITKPRNWNKYSAAMQKVIYIIESDK
jgi:hypothetical protein